MIKLNNIFKMKEEKERSLKFVTCNLKLSIGMSRQPITNHQSPITNDQ